MRPKTPVKFWITPAASKRPQGRDAKARARVEIARATAAFIEGGGKITRLSSDVFGACPIKGAMKKYRG